MLCHKFSRYIWLLKVSAGIQNCFLKSKLERRSTYYFAFFISVHSVPGGKVNILGGHSIGHSKQKRKSIYVHVSYSERFPR
jgi:hypothetical protein